MCYVNSRFSFFFCSRAESVMNCKRPQQLRKFPESIFHMKVNGHLWRGSLIVARTIRHNLTWVSSCLNQKAGATKPLPSRMKTTFVRAQVRSRIPGADTYLYVSKRGEKGRERERDGTRSFGVDDCPILEARPSPFDSRVESPRSERGRKRKKEDKERETATHEGRFRLLSPPLASSRLHRSTQSRIITRAHRLVSSRSARRYTGEKERARERKRRGMLL